MGKVTVIGITGKARAGKDSIAQAIFDQCTRSGAAWVERQALADPIKTMLETVLDHFVVYYTETEEMLYGNKKEVVFEPIGKSPREMLQSLGTEWGRNSVSPTIWIDIAKRKIEALRKRSLLASNATFYVIPDIRYDNERALCDILIHVHRPFSNEPLTGDASRHVSEAGLSDIGASAPDYRYHNNGTLADLSRWVTGLLGVLMKEDHSDGEPVNAC